MKQKPTNSLEKTTNESTVLKFRLPTPYPVGRVNAYLIPGPEPVLIDTGVFSEKSLGDLESGFEQAGYRFEDIRHILVTHYHTDHSGAVFYLSQKAKAPIYLFEQSRVKTGFQAETKRRLLAYMERCGVGAEMLELSRGIYKEVDPFADRESIPYEIIPLRDGETVEPGGLEIQALHTKGHCTDHLCYFNPDDGLLFTGDTLLPKITPNPLLSLNPDNDYKREKSLLNYIDSLNKLKACNAAIGYPGHGANIPNVNELIDKNFGFIERRKKRLLEKITDTPQTPIELAKSIWGKLDVINLFLAISETVAYLDILERDFDVNVDWQGERILISR